MNIYANYDPIIVRCPGKVKRERALQFQLGFAAAGGVGGQLHARLLEHEPCRDAGIAVVVLVAVIHHLGNAGLDDGLGALVAGEEGHIHPRALEVVVGAVEDGVELRVADVHILGVQGFTLPLPGHLVVAAAHGHPVVAQGEDLVFRADDARTHLTVGVLGAHGREQGNAHEIFVPVDVIAAFHRGKTSF